MKWLLAVILICSLVQVTFSFLMLLQLGKLIEMKETDWKADESA